MLNLSISRRRKNRTLIVRRWEHAYAEYENKREIGAVNPCYKIVTHASPCRRAGLRHA